MTTDRVDTGTERVASEVKSRRSQRGPVGIYDPTGADLLESLATERDDLAILLDAAIEDRDYWKKRYHGMKERAARRLAERDTLRTQLDTIERERDALVEALTPSASTKAAYMGEFSWEEDSGTGRGKSTRWVPWTTIKEIMKEIADRARTQQEPQ